MKEPSSKFKRISTHSVRTSNHCRIILCLLVQRVITKKRAKKCNTINIYKRDNLILGTADLFAETFQMLNDIKDFNIKEKNEKIENITEANELEDKCNHYRSVFEDLTKKLKSFQVAWHTGQDCEVYKGLLLSIDYIGHANAYIYVYNIE